jgi:peroxiredoxin Q/BCP
VEILGVSFDSMVDNAAFAKKYRIPYPLLSDADTAVAKAYGAYNERSPGHARRNVYVIAADGSLEMTFDGVNAKTFPRAILDVLKK